ncbi:TPR domain protein [Geotalea daltonii FRC-32]|uniref:protein O-GlcNAc transferase n=1 Tax=Geotalea daltonii (strain DSM 22248 / JCM 15807 / FRC-32) TaxID=316067 RepID=B9M0H6_GEODF|nr:glycosyltransferase family 41 protein [Geotalea daltonii]ACM19013.1 TPR domain protein [Geotalea daltonii FRC-32]
MTTAETTYKYIRILINKGMIAEAEELLEQVLAESPEHLDALLSLGVILAHRGDTTRAETCFRQIVAHTPHAQGFFHLANLLCNQGKTADAETLYRQALTLEPGFSQALNNLGSLCRNQGRLEEAAGYFRQALALDPDYLTAKVNLGIVLRLLLSFSDAAALFEEIIEAHPECAAAYFNLGNTLLSMGDAEAAVTAYRKALSCEPDNMGAFDNLLIAMAFSPTVDASQLYDEHRRFTTKFATPLKNQIKLHGNRADPNRRLKIGYVSADFRLHAVAYFIEPVLAAHGRENFEIHCYANVGTPDRITDHTMSLADQWRNIYGMSDAMVAELIREDGIDILVDLAGHTSGHRLLVFARKPAPIQVEFIGYPNTSGLDTIDYLITDEITSPEKLPQLFSEEPLRLPETRYCFSPVIATPEVSILPMQQNGSITLGCFNNVAKINQRVITLWAKILHTLRDSRLLLKNRLFDDPGCARTFQDRFTHAGIDPGRIMLRGHSSHMETLREYSLVDIALDTFPFPGGTTTCEALWMGVPVVAMSGVTFAERQAISLLANAGHREWIATSEEEYMEIVLDLAADPVRLAQVRSNLRHELQSSPLMDAPRFVALLEDAYRRMWLKWCRNQA